MAFGGEQAKLWTALPGIIGSFDPEAQTCTVQPAISGDRRMPDGSIQAIQMPVLLDCPVLWQGGGGVTLTFPIKPGDECLIVFASRCIDFWWQQGGVQGQAELRMHDLSDGFVLVGVRSQPRKFNVSTSAAQLRTDDGAAFVEVYPDTKFIRAETTADIEAVAGGNISMTAGVKISMTAPLIQITGTITSNGKVIDYTHTHSGVDPGGGTSGPPV